MNVTRETLLERAEGLLRRLLPTAGRGSPDPFSVMQCLGKARFSNYWRLRLAVFHRLHHAADIRGPRRAGTLKLPGTSRRHREIERAQAGVSFTGGY